MKDSYPTKTPSISPVIACSSPLRPRWPCAFMCRRSGYMRSRKNMPAASAHLNEPDSLLRTFLFACNRWYDSETYWSICTRRSIMARSTTSLPLASRICAHFVPPWSSCSSVDHAASASSHGIKVPCPYRFLPRMVAACSDTSLTRTPILECEGSKSTGQSKWRSRSLEAGPMEATTSFCTAS